MGKSRQRVWFQSRIAEEWDVTEKTSQEVRKRNSENRKFVYKRAEQYAKEYSEQERELIRLKREAKLDQIKFNKEIKAETVIPDHVLKKNRIAEEWALVEKTSQEVQKRNSENRKLIYKRAEEYAKEYSEYSEQEWELIRLKREAKLAQIK